MMPIDSKPSADVAALDTSTDQLSGSMDDSSTDQALSVTTSTLTGETVFANADVNTASTLTIDHPAMAGLQRLREKLNSLGSFVVSETEALLSEIETHLK